MRRNRMPDLKAGELNDYAETLVFRPHVFGT